MTAAYAAVIALCDPEPGGPTVFEANVYSLDMQVTLGRSSVTTVKHYATNEISYDI